MKTKILSLSLSFLSLMMVGLCLNTIAALAEVEIDEIGLDKKDKSVVVLTKDDAIGLDVLIRNYLGQYAAPSTSTTKECLGSGKAKCEKSLKKYSGPIQIASISCDDHPFATLTRPNCLIYGQKGFIARLEDEDFQAMFKLFSASRNLVAKANQIENYEINLLTVKSVKCDKAPKSKAPECRIQFKTTTGGAA